MSSVPSFGKKAGGRSPAKPKRRTFEASYDGWCYECSDHIYAGDSVGYNESDELVHEECL